MDALLESSASQGKQELDALLGAIDTRAPLARWILPQTSVVWNGSPLAGPDALSHMLAQTPPTAHSLGAFNAHPLPNQNMSISASGQVQIGPELPKGASFYGFSLFCILSQIPGGPLAVQTMTYRLVHKPQDSLLEH